MRFWYFRRQRDTVIDSLIAAGYTYRFKGFDPELRDRTARRKTRQVDRVARFKQRLMVTR